MPSPNNSKKVNSMNALPTIPIPSKFHRLYSGLILLMPPRTTLFHLLMGPFATPTRTQPTHPTPHHPTPPHPRPFLTFTSFDLHIIIQTSILVYLFLFKFSFSPFFLFSRKHTVFTLLQSWVSWFCYPRTKSATAHYTKRVCERDLYHKTGGFSQEKNPKHPKTKKDSSPSLCHNLHSPSKML